MRSDGAECPNRDDPYAEICVPWVGSSSCGGASGAYATLKAFRGAVGEDVGPAVCKGVRDDLVATATTGDGVPAAALQSMLDAIGADAMCIGNRLSDVKYPCILVSPISNDGRDQMPIANPTVVSIRSRV